ncbi:unnamed protein product [Schistocephalus solidus]|uniref:Hemerythrin domain-containing protein n=1 Tax=Schistocephalus solidus TaxID=70667 RepID=A0A183T1F8_SCHSO|nr:unnamed protein product [Schistocephalus solidus]
MAKVEAQVTRLLTTVATLQLHHTSEIIAFPAFIRGRITSGGTMPTLIETLTDAIASIQKQTVLPSSCSSPWSSVRDVQPTTSSRSKIDATCRYHRSSVPKPVATSPLAPLSPSRAVNTSLIATFGACSLSLDIGPRHFFPRVFSVVDIPSAILSADLLATFYLLVGQTTKLTV